MKKRNIIKKLGAMLCAAALVLAPLSTASAATAPWPTTGTGDITVHKYFRDTASTTAGDGKEITNAAELAALGTAANDTDKKVGFTLYKVNEVAGTFEMSTSTTVAQALAHATPVIGPTGSLGDEEEFTDSNGEISWTNLAFGYYVLVETTSLNGYDPAASAIIALPYALNEDNWNDDIHVYPKNVKQEPLVKEDVSGTGSGNTAYGVGDEITWKYTAPVDDYEKLYTPEVLDTDGVTVLTPAAYGTYKIVDTLDARLDHFVNATTDKVVSKGITDVTLILNTDYTIASVPATASDPATITWTLTNAGLEKVALNESTEIEVTFSTKVNQKASATGDGNDEIANGGELVWKNIGDSTESKYEIEEDDKPVVKLYSLVISKTNNDGTVFLNGAEFKIAKTKADAEAGIFIKAADGTTDLIVMTANHATSYDTAGNVLTSVDGWALFTGLTGSETVDTSYFLVETIAPTKGTDKYVRPTEPIEVKLKAAQQETTVAVKNYLITDPDIPAIWELPLTGGMGTMAFYVIGIVLMFGAVTLYIRSKRVKGNR